jgi:Mg-chelatase subunit ChlD
MEKKEKTQIYNLVVLDKSGSMGMIRRAAMEGFNETLAGIKKAQREYAETQQHYISLVTFCSCSRDAVYDKVPVAEAEPLTLDQYEPCCCTPLYDAMGFALTSLRSHVKDIDDVAVVVTIITDGLENASREYNRNSIRALVDSLKKEGWSFTFMGANQNSSEVAQSLAIRNSQDFDYSVEGIDKAYRRDRSSKMAYFRKLDSSWSKRSSMSKENRSHMNTDLADEAFDETKDV